MRPLVGAAGAAVVPPVAVDVSWMAGGGGGLGVVRLERDAKGRVTVGEGVGKRSAGEEEVWRRTRRRRERKKQQQHMTAEQTQNEEEMQWETDDTTLPQPTTSNPPPPTTSSSPQPGWPRTAARLHRHQRHLLQLQLYNALMAEAKGWQYVSLAAVSVLSHTIHCHSPAFPPLSVAFEDGPQHPFTLRTSGSSDTAVDSHALYLSLLSQLTRHFTRYASSNRPLPTLSTTTTTQDDPANSLPPPPPLLHHLVTTIYHTHLTTTIRTALHTALPLAAAPTELAEAEAGWAGSVNVMRFVLKWRGGGGLLLLDGVVDGVSMHGVVRRGRRLGVLGGADGGGWQ